MRSLFLVLLYVLISNVHVAAQFPNTINGGCYNGSCYSIAPAPTRFIPVPNSAYGNTLRYSYTDSQWYYKHIVETGNNFLPNPYAVLEETLKRDRQNRSLKVKHQRKKIYTDDVFDSIMNIR